MNDEFYIGYQKKAPARLARFVFAAAAAIVVCASVAALVIGGAQSAPGDGEYAFGTVESFEGIVTAEPFLHLLVERDEGEPGRVGLLVGQGKHRAPEFVAEAAGQRVRLGGTRIERGGVLMLETAGANAFEVLGPADSRPEARSAHSVTLTGELVDTKCYLGVMNPGRGKVHRGCAVECLRGGVPPGLVLMLPDGSDKLVILTGAAINAEWAGRVVAVTGSLDATGTPWVVEVDNVQLTP